MLLTGWIYVHECQEKIKEASWILLGLVGTILGCFTLGNTTSRLMICPLLAWIIFALIMNTTEVQYWGEPIGGNDKIIIDNGAGGEAVELIKEGVSMSTTKPNDVVVTNNGEILVSEGNDVVVTNLDESKSIYLGEKALPNTFFERPNTFYENFKDDHKDVSCQLGVCWND